MRSYGADFVRGADLTRTAAGPSIDRLRTNLAARLTRRIEAAQLVLRAGVLVPIVVQADGLALLLTRRTETVLTHKGQISFPGGQREDHDQTIVETALRETSEEIGLDPARVEVIGALDDTFTAVSNFVISPVIGLIAGQLPDLRPAPTEVKDILIIPLASLLDESVHTRQVRTIDGQRHTIHYYRVGEDVIWGATGRIVFQLLTVWNP